MSQAIDEASDFIIRICGQLSAALQIFRERGIDVRLDSQDMDTNIVDVLADLHEIKIYLDSAAGYAEAKENQKVNINEIAEDIIRTAHYADAIEKRNRKTE